MKNDIDSHEKSIEFWTDLEKEHSKSFYGCEIIKEKCGLDDAKDKSLPIDSFVVSYCCGETIYYDIVRSVKRVNVFNMYWDKFRKNLTKIEWTDGRVNPKLWGYQSPKSKKRK